MIMETKTLSPRQLRERKFLFVAPVFVLPLFTILFWAGGGGKDAAKKEMVGRGFDMDIPGVHLPNRKGWTKTDYYKQAQQDSLAAAEKERSQEGYAKRIGLPGDSAEVAAAGTAAAHVRQVQEKVSELSRVLEGAGRSTGVDDPHPMSVQRGIDDPHRVSVRRSEAEPDIPTNPDIDKLEKILGQVKKKEEVPDPQLEQLNSIVEKLVSVEGSGRKDLISKGGNKDSPQDSLETMKKDRQGDVVSVRLADSVRADIDDGPGDNGSMGMDAWVAEKQSLVSGARIELELGHDLLVGKKLIPRGSPVYGQAGLSGERLLVSIRTISFEGKVYPVALQAYDQDGLPGIYIPGMQGAQSLKESGEQDINSLGPELLSPTLAGQVAGAGLQTARSLLGKKIRLIRVTVPAGYRLLLMDENKTR
jgi:Conjugative transposon, TraM